MIFFKKINMFDLNIQEIDFDHKNTILKKNINIDQDLDCCIIISSKDKILAENVLNNAIEHIIDKISKTDTYNDFGIALENINSYIKSWKIDEENDEKKQRLDMVISIINENDFMFSNIGKSSTYLLNTNGELLELTEKWENKKEFLFISNGSLTNGDIIISSTTNLLKYVTKSDLVDGMVLAHNMEFFWKNIKNILKSEIVNKNILVSSIKYKNEFLEEKDSLANVKNFFMKIADLKFSKTVLSHFLRIKDTIDLQSKKTKNMIFLWIITLVIILLYFLVSKIVFVSTKEETKQVAKTAIVEIEEFIQVASQNLANPETFRINIEKAENKIAEVKKENLFKAELEDFTSNINIMKKQFEKIEIFEAKNENVIYSKNLDGAFDVTKVNKRIYVFTKKWVVWPIVWDAKNVKTYIFNDLQENEYFTDYAVIKDNIFLLTNTSKIVRFTSNGRFSFMNVSGQTKWEDMKSIDAYSANIYSLWKDNQIYRHRALNNAFGAKRPYLKDSDKKEIWKIKDIAIDWGFYIVKDNLEVVKFFSSPYRIESLFLNNLPRWKYKQEKDTKFRIQAGYNLNYVFMLLNNKIWVFKTNSNDFRNTTSLTYLWQVEWSKNKIIDFYVESDKKIIVLNKTGLYTLNFEVSDNKIVLR